MRAASILALLALSSCASVEFERTTSTSGTFVSRGFSFTFLSWDVPQRAVDIALENASDAGQPNTVPTSQWIFPYLGPLDWLLDILSVRYAVVRGTWGFEDGELTSVDADTSSAGAAPR